MEDAAGERVLAENLPGGFECGGDVVNMSLKKIQDIFASIDSCSDWSLLLL